MLAMQSVFYYEILKMYIAHAVEKLFVGIQQK